MKLKIANNIYEIVFVENLEKNGQKALGILEPLEGKIYIEKNLQKRDKFATIIHEVMHELLQNLNIATWLKKNKEEDFVSIFSIWFAIFLLDNNIEDILKEL